MKRKQFLKLVSHIDNTTILDADNLAFLIKDTASDASRMLTKVKNKSAKFTKTELNVFFSLLLQLHAVVESVAAHTNNLIDIQDELGVLLSIAGEQENLPTEEEFKEMNNDLS